MTEREYVCNIFAHLTPITDEVKQAIREKHRQMLLDQWDGKTRAQQTSIWNFTLWTYKGEYQIARTVSSHIKWYDRRRKMDFLYVDEVAQWYVNVYTGKEFNVMRPFHYPTHDFAYNRPMRYTESKSGFANYVANSEGYPFGRIMLHPIIRRNGLTADMMRRVEKDKRIRVWNDKHVISCIIRKPFFETLIKSHLWRLTGSYQYELPEKAIRLLLRNKIEIDQADLHDFNDAIRMMTDEHIDWHNAKILREWRRWHDVAMERKHKRDLEHEAERLIQDKAIFAETHKHLIGIAWVDGDLHYKSLDSIEEYYEEGKAMHHCVYANRYFRKADALIISVRDDNGARLATMEYSVGQDKVIQCRAACNGVPERYDEILAKFSNNKKIIKDRRYEECIEESEKA